MKLLIASDIHCHVKATRQLIEKFNEEGCDRILLLGDILYCHDFGEDEDECDRDGVISLLNSYADKITMVRGNCDTDRDLESLFFTVYASHNIFKLDGITVFASHGHRYSPLTPPTLSDGTVMLGGHTHRYAIARLKNGIIYINPGAMDPASESYAIYENRSFKIKDFSGNTLAEITL